MYNACALSEKLLTQAWEANMRALVGIAPRPHFGVFQRVVNSVARNKSTPFIRLEFWRRLLLSEFWAVKEKEGIALPDVSNEVMTILCSLRDEGPRLFAQVQSPDDLSIGESFWVGLCETSLERIAGLQREGKRVKIHGGDVEHDSPRFFSLSAMSGQRWGMGTNALMPCASPHV